MARSSRPRSLLATTALVGAALLAAVTTPGCQRRSSEWSSVFHRQEGWLYADGGSSARLPDGRTVWLFGDSFVRHDQGLLFNSIAVQDSEHDRAPAVDEVHFFGRAADGAILDLSRRGQDGMRPWIDSADRADGWKTWLWPTDAIASGGRLVAFYTEVGCVKEEFPACRSYLGNMAIAGHSVVVVDNPGDDVSRWSRRRITLADRNGRQPIDSRLIWGSALVEEGGWLYVFGAVQRGDGLQENVKLARVLPANVEHYERWQFLTTRGWRMAPTGVTPEELETVAPAGSTMLSVVPVDRNGERHYVMVHVEPFAQEVVVQTARADGVASARFAAEPGRELRRLPLEKVDPAVAGGRGWAGRVQRGYRGEGGALVLGYFATTTASLRFVDLKLADVLGSR